ncbi:hypothetical protein N0V90_010628 [Kalmusia sp. IMI 367209]|nr:hypothetical protein N0V90_010628 [Kalmusia sp. IMI 367209]
MSDNVEPLDKVEKIGDYNFVVSSFSYKDSNYSTSNATDDQLNDLANIYLSYHDSCKDRSQAEKGEYPQKLHNKEGYSAYKAIVRVCVQTLKSTFNSSTANNDEVVHGTAWEQVPFFKLEPAWLTLPAIVYLTITVLFVSTIIQSERNGEPVWKHTTLGVLRALNGEKATELEAKVKEDLRNSYMHLVHTRGFWHLYEVSGDKVASRKHKVEQVINE